MSKVANAGKKFTTQERSEIIKSLSKLKESVVELNNQIDYLILLSQNIGINDVQEDGVAVQAYILGEKANEALEDAI